ncbi:hypothetical protein RchiOBHm_Chr6g0295361 [Rosa chinensis]|uniref:Uncharacterized protein n=1 Tax=Rosa chinensis TaxID=74649 RepID=A0A2P6PX64_ROSCH|nr:hypothetical protein RchiOBHm_Chr6g0295361 [Rosa chinensis]
MFTGNSFFLWAKRKGRFPRLFIIVRRMSDGMKWSAFMCASMSSLLSFNWSRESSSFAYFIVFG